MWTCATTSPEIVSGVRCLNFAAFSGLFVWYLQQNVKARIETNLACRLGKLSCDFNKIPMMTPQQDELSQSQHQKKITMINLSKTSSHNLGARKLGFGAHRTDGKQLEAPAKFNLLQTLSAGDPCCKRGLQLQHLHQPTVNISGRAEGQESRTRAVVGPIIQSQHKAPYPPLTWPY